MEYTSEQKEMFERYETLKATIKDAEAELKPLNALLLTLVPEDKEIEGEYGKFYIQMKSKWKYSDEVETRQNEIDNLKEEEQARGVATQEKSPVLYYKQGK